ncbi:MAG: hypothetical protein AAB726_00490 [Patescibacteria group bacterium]
MQARDSMLGKVFMAIGGLEESKLGIFIDIALRLAGIDGDRWLSDIKRFLRGEDDLLERLIQRVGGLDAVHRLASGELVVSTPALRWREEDGVIYFSVTSNGKTGEEWITWFKENGYSIGSEAEFVLRSPSFKTTNNVTYRVAVLKGELFSDTLRTTENIRADGQKRGWSTPNAELACLIRANYSDEEIKAMGLWWIIAMHDTIKGSDGYPSLLGAGRDGDGRRLSAFYAWPGYGWGREDGFAFVVSQVCA